MSDITVSKKDEVCLVVKPNDSGIIMELSEFFTFYVPGYKFVPSYRNKMWDGKIRLYNTRDYTLPGGLFYHLKKFAESRGYKVEVEGLLSKDRRSLDDDWLYKLPICNNGTDISLRDYQTNAIEHSIKYNKTLLLSPTGYDLYDSKIFSTNFR